MPVSTEKTYRVIGPCSLSGRWSGTDRRAPVRRALRQIGWRLPSPKIRRWIDAVTDDRKRDYRTRFGRSVEAARRLLNTAEDVEARSAGHLAGRYWEVKERTGKRPDLAAMAGKEG